MAKNEKANPKREGVMEDRLTAHSSKKRDLQTRGQYERDPKGRKGQYTGAGEHPIMKK